eukprot:NODE_2888_length_1071_cov_24.903602_g2755_i0.p1 GENE.NODE_2888_length_1071_cov_24.903602_g2755_i0~~NODE_2888_length_1071_cov_24.903602_g2755_i0.p1  ORF type:complete len:340 (+),score=65.38 NODE_2888_length_1071_cov_24.903602_g2755_i0:3-1022(+)
MEDICVPTFSGELCSAKHCTLAHEPAQLQHLDHWVFFSAPELQFLDFLAYKYQAHPYFKCHFLLGLGPLVRAASAADAQNILSEYAEYYEPQPLSIFGQSDLSEAASDAHWMCDGHPSLLSSFTHEPFPASYEAASGAHWCDGHSQPSSFTSQDLPPPWHDCCPPEIYLPLRDCRGSSPEPYSELQGLSSSSNSLLSDYHSNPGSASSLTTSFTSFIPKVRLSPLIPCPKPEKLTPKSIDCGPICAAEVLLIIEESPEERKHCAPHWADPSVLRRALALQSDPDTVFCVQHPIDLEGVGMWDGHPRHKRVKRSNSSDWAQDCFTAVEADEYKRGCCACE